jgi:hypothetical protein
VRYIVEYRASMECICWDIDEIFTTYGEAFAYATAQVIEHPSFEHRIIRRTTDSELITFPRVEDC